MSITTKSYIHYIFDIDPTNANCMICQICKAKIVCVISTSNARRHVSINHLAVVDEAIVKAMLEGFTLRGQSGRNSFLPFFQKIC